MGKLVLVRHGQSQWNLENRFTGWVDVPLTAQGEAEARRAGEWLKGHGFKFDQAFTSVLQRAQNTLRIILEVLGQKNVPTEKNQALNERHYGALQGLDKAETAKKYGDEQVKIWRRSYDVMPPADKTEFNPEGITESLQTTAARALPYFYSNIMPAVKKGETVIVAAHGNSLRSIVMDLDKLTKAQVLELNIDTGKPIVYDIDDHGKVTGKKSA
jgi:2,3-bisphosphoglycerate-dependent phosphoglycerate mutase